MKYIIPIILLILFSFTTTYNNKPTTIGIDNYVENNKHNIVLEVEEFLQDSIYYYYIKTDDLSLYTNHDTLELGRYYYPQEIIITNEEKYQYYELSEMPRWKRRNVNYSSKFVKAVLIHEITHIYFNQVINIRQYNQEYVDVRYEPQRVFGITKTNWNAEFIEEGICEYVIHKMGEAIYDDDIDIKPTEILNKPDNNKVKYRYSSAFLREFLDSCYNVDGNLRNAIEIIVRNEPPTIDEIIYDKYFDRLQ